MANSSEDRRKFVRMPIAARVKFTDGDREEVWFTDDMSEGGLFLKTDKPPFAGTTLDLEISLPDVEELIRIKGEVIWRHEGRGCGVRFMRATQQLRDIIRNFVETQHAQAEKS